MMHVVFIGVQIQVETMDQGEKYTLIGYISDDSGSNDCLPDLDYRPMARTKQTPRGRGGRGGRPPPRSQPDSSSVEEISSSDTEPFSRDNDDPSWSPGKRTPVKEWGACGTPVKKQVKRRRGRGRGRRGGRRGGTARAARAPPVPPAPAPVPGPQFPWPAPGMNLPRPPAPVPQPQPQPRPPAPVPQPQPQPRPPAPVPQPQPRPPAPVPQPQPRPPAPVPQPQPRPPAPVPQPQPQPRPPAPVRPLEPPVPPPVDPAPVPDLSTPVESGKRPNPKEPPSVGTTPERPTTPTRRPNPKEPPSTGTTPERLGTPKRAHPWAIVVHRSNTVPKNPDGPWKLREDENQSGTVVVRQVIDKITRVGSTPPGHRKPDPNEPASVGGTPEHREPSTPDGDPPASPVPSFSSADPGLPDDFSSPDSENNQKDNPDPPDDPPVDPDNPLIVPRNDAAVDAWFNKFAGSDGSDFEPYATPADTSGTSPDSSSTEDEPPPPKKPRVEPTKIHRDPQKVARRRQQEIHRPPLITPPKPKPGKKKKDDTAGTSGATRGTGETVASNSYWHKWKQERELGRVASMYTSKRGYFRPSEEQKETLSLWDIYRKEVKHYQTNQEPVIPVRPFIRAVRWMTTDVVNRMYDPVVGTYPPEEKKMFRFQAEAYHALLEASEAYLSGHLLGAWWCARHAGRSTLMPKDLWLECKMRGIEKYGNKWDEWTAHGTLLDSGTVVNGSLSRIKKSSLAII